MAALCLQGAYIAQAHKFEKAFAYKLQMEALQKQRGRIQNGVLSSNVHGVKAGGQVVHPKKGRDILAENQDETGRNVQRYIRLTNLLREWLEQLDSGGVPVMAGYEISFLDTETQREVYRYFFQTDTKDKLTVRHAESIRAALHGCIYNFCH